MLDVARLVVGAVLEGLVRLGRALVRTQHALARHVAVSYVLSRVVGQRVKRSVRRAVDVVRPVLGSRRHVPRAVVRCRVKNGV